MPAGIEMAVELLVKLINVPPGKLPFDALKQLVANDTFFETKVVIFKKLVNLLYEIRSMPAGKLPKN